MSNRIYRQMNNLWAAVKARKQDISALLGIGVFYLGLEIVFGITCPIKFLTGVSCAGCGMSRAYFSLLHLDVEKAFLFHPLFLLPVAAVALFLCKKRIRKIAYDASFFAMAVMVIAVYLFRMFYVKTDPIVVFRPEEGVLFRLYLWLNDIL